MTLKTWLSGFMIPFLKCDSSENWEAVIIP